MIVLYIIIFIIILFILNYRPPNKKHTNERDILISYSNEINDLIKKIRSGPPKEELLIYYKRLAKLYHNGVNNQYIDGRLVKGIKPDPHKAIDIYRNIGMMDDLSVLLDWASIHHWGVTDFEDLKDHKKASEIYIHLYYKYDDIYSKQLAKDRLASLGIEIEKYSRQEKNNI
jgi:hypothetical protein